jgi:YfiH family protein
VTALDDTAPVPITVTALTRLAGVRHGFFTRQGGLSEGGFASLNCSLSSGDEPGLVRANRALAARRLGVAADRLMLVQQVHGKDVALVDQAWPLAQAPSADALVTARRGVALGVLGADCAPVLLADGQAGVIGAAHAGWRGALGGVLESVVAAMVGLGARAERMVAVVGPCIHQPSYEVGPEFPAPFLAEDPANGGFFAPSERPGHSYFDLPGYIVRRLAGLSVGEIVATPHDTLSEEERFFSHRRSSLRGEKACGRQLSAIGLEG